MTTKPKPRTRIAKQPQWDSYCLDEIVIPIQRAADDSDQIMVYDLNGIDIVCHPGESPKTAVRLWMEALDAEDAAR